MLRRQPTNTGCLDCSLGRPTCVVGQSLQYITKPPTCNTAMPATFLPQLMLSSWEMHFEPLTATAVRHYTKQLHMSNPTHCSSHSSNGHSPEQNSFPLQVEYGHVHKSIHWATHSMQNTSPPLGPHLKALSSMTSSTLIKSRMSACMQVQTWVNAHMDGFRHCLHFSITRKQSPKQVKD